MQEIVIGISVLIAVWIVLGTIGSAGRGRGDGRHFDTKDPGEWLHGADGDDSGF